MKSALTGITAISLPKYWPIIRPRLEPLVTESGENITELYEALLNKEANLVISIKDEEIDCICITELLRLKGENDELIANIRYVIGAERENWMCYLEIFEQWAKLQGCTKVVILKGRLGWMRELQPLGYKAARVMLEKELI